MMANKALIIGSIVLTVVCISGSLWFSYTQYQQRLADAARPNITQEQIDEAARLLAEQEATRLEEIRKNLKPIDESYAHLRQQQREREQAEQKADDEYLATPDGDITVERPEFSKPEPPPPPSVPEEELKDPNSKPEIPKEPAKPTAPQGGDKRPDTDGDGLDEVYVGGFGWLPHSPGGTHEVGDFELSGDIIGY